MPLAAPSHIEKSKAQYKTSANQTHGLYHLQQKKRNANVLPTRYNGILLRFSLLHRAMDVNKLAIALLASALLLVGCGQKGPLQLPTATSQSSQS